MPLAFYRIGLGGFERLYGMHWILVTTRGRRTGKPHSVLVDIIDYDRPTDTYTVQPAFGRRADWVRNIEKTPIFEAQVGRRRFRAKALPVEAGEGAERMLRFIASHPVEWWMIGWMLGVKPPAEAKSEEQMKSWLAREFMFLGIRPAGPFPR